MNFLYDQIIVDDFSKIKFMYFQYISLHPIKWRYRCNLYMSKCFCIVHILLTYPYEYSTVHILLIVSAAASALGQKMRLYRKTTQTTAYHELATLKRSSHEQARTLVCVIYSQRVCARVCVCVQVQSSTVQMSVVVLSQQTKDTTVILSYQHTH